MHSKQIIETSSVTLRRQSFWSWLLADWSSRVAERLNLCMEVKRERDVLAKLSDAELRDIGVHRADADAESRRGFHDLPADRLGLHADIDGRRCDGMHRRGL